MNKKAIIFDFDGTIVYSEPLIGTAIYYAYKDITNEEISVEKMLSFYGPTELGMLKNMLPNYDYHEAFKLYLKYYQEYHQKLVSCVDSKLIDIFEELNKKDIPIYILTGRSQESLNLSLDILNIKKYFKVFFVGSIDGINKPTSIKKLKEKYHYDSNDLLYIGDTLQDIKSMKEVNVKIISANYFKEANNFEILNKNNRGNVANSYLELKEKINEFLNSK